jgi:hypothetical protein
MTPVADALGNTNARQLFLHSGGGSRERCIIGDNLALKFNGAPSRFFRARFVNLLCTLGSIGKDLHVMPVTNLHETAGHRKQRL